MAARTTVVYEVAMNAWAVVWVGGGRVGLCFALASCSGTGLEAPACEPPMQACPVSTGPDGGTVWLEPPACVAQGQCYVLRGDGLGGFAVNR